MENNDYWDDIDVGKCDLNHSQNFFKEVHLKHEKINSLNYNNNNSEEWNYELSKENADNVDKTNNNDSITSLLNGKNNETESFNGYEDVDSRILQELKNFHINEIQQLHNKQQQINDQQSNMDKMEHGIKIKTDEPSITLIESTKKITIIHNDDDDDGKEYSNSTIKKDYHQPIIKTPKTGGRNATITKQHRDDCYSNNNHNHNKAVNIYNYVDYYEKRKKYQMERVNAEEKKQRIFHSKPVPNFKQLHQIVSAKAIDYAKSPTVTKTPKVYRKAELQRHIKSIKFQEYLNSLEPPVFKSSEPKVLYKPPFIPKIEKQDIPIKPFNLKSAQRSEQRKKYDENYLKLIEERLLKETEQKRLEDERIIKLIRKASEFKANPNPFA